MTIKIFREVQVSSKLLDDQGVLDILIGFCKETRSYEFLHKESQDYSEGIRCHACFIHSHKTSATESAGIALAQQRPRTFYVANVIPRDKAELTIREYNDVLVRFVADLRKYIKYIGKKEVAIDAKITVDTIGINQIIASTRPLELFKRYLGAFPRSYHPSDIRRLDIFICALSRCRRKVDLGYLECYLIQDLNWNKKDASWCVQRIETGLDILKANRR